MERRERKREEEVRERAKGERCASLLLSFIHLQESKFESFVVQYLGSLPVAKKEGIEAVKEPIKVHMYVQVN